tara:strand:+ start:872 stop:1324 length:453 start_codon:yes stop_codon:yes gene_type:complete
MAKKFRGPEIIKQIDEALDKGMARFLILTQGKLSKNSPVDSGRMASSWFIGQGVPNREVPAPQGTPSTYRKGVKVKQGQQGPITQVKPTQKITIETNAYISSNLDYSERVCFDPKYSKGGRGGSGWFTKIANNLDKDAEKAFSYFLKKVK